MNNEEKSRWQDICSENSDLFYHEGQKLTNIHETRHKIVTNTERPVYAKIYKYPNIHEEEIDKQITEM